MRAVVTRAAEEREAARRAVGRTAAIRLVGAMVVVAAGVSSCTYLQQREDLMSGGPQQREAAANAALESARTENQNLHDEDVRLQREIERNNRRIEAAQSDLTKLSSELDQAKARQAISEAQYRRLKSQIANTNADLNALDMQQKADAVTGNDQSAAREQQLRALEKKKAELEKALAAGTGP